jgi:hypothetical protein
MKATMRDWLEPSRVRWQDAEAGPWQITLRWSQIDGRVECVGVALDPLSPDKPCIVSTATWRAIPLRSLITQARRARFEEFGGHIAEAAPDLAASGLDQSWLDHFEATSAPWRDRSRGRPVELGPDHYREVAEEYSRAFSDGGSRQPLQAIRQRWDVSKPTASRWVAAARELKLLPPTGRGRTAAAGEGKPPEARRAR